MRYFSSPKTPCNLILLNYYEVQLQHMENRVLFFFQRGFGEKKDRGEMELLLINIPVNVNVYVVVISFFEMSVVSSSLFFFV